MGSISEGDLDLGAVGAVGFWLDIRWPPSQLAAEHPIIALTDQKACSGQVWRLPTNYAATCILQEVVFQDASESRFHRLSRCIGVGPATVKASMGFEMHDCQILKATNQIERTARPLRPLSPCGKSAGHTYASMLRHLTGA